MASSGDLTLHSTTVSGGRGERLNLPDSGGVYNRGILTLTNSTVSGNSSFSYDSGGGGVFNSGTLTLTNSTVSGNDFFGNLTVGGGGVFTAAPSR